MKTGMLLSGNTNVKHVVYRPSVKPTIRDTTVNTKKKDNSSAIHAGRHF